jgi:YceI-like protein
MNVLRKAALSAGVTVLLAAGVGAVTFPDGKACVAWKTKKTMFLLKKLEPVGINCSVSVHITPKGAGQQVIVEIPIAAFDSGEKARDKQVLTILKSDVAPALVFTSREYASAEWDGVKIGKIALIEGSLSIGGESFPISMPFLVSRDASMVASGVLVTTFSRFKIAPPKVAGGLIANVQDYLELHYRVPLSMVVQ